jgi:hypothetical protein
MRYIAKFRRPLVAAFVALAGGLALVLASGATTHAPSRGHSHVVVAADAIGQVQNA